MEEGGIAIQQILIVVIVHHLLRLCVGVVHRVVFELIELVFIGIGHSWSHIAHPLLALTANQQNGQTIQLLVVDLAAACDDVDELVDETILDVNFLGQQEDDVQQLLLLDRVFVIL